VGSLRRRKGGGEGVKHLTLPRIEIKRTQGGSLDAQKAYELFFRWNIWGVLKRGLVRCTKTIRCEENRGLQLCLVAHLI